MNKATFTDINNGTEPLYIVPVTINRMGTTVQGQSQVQVQVQGTAITPEFYLADPVIIQYQCNKNCLVCSFSLSQTSTCDRCEAFYSMDKNCLSCANGFFEVVDVVSSRCLKCYSNCKQCQGPSQYDCIACFSNFGLIDYAFHRLCIDKVASQYRKQPVMAVCLTSPSLSEVSLNSNCSACLGSTSNNIYKESTCIECWVSLGYAWGRCAVLSSSGLTFYASEGLQG